MKINHILDHKESQQISRNPPYKHHITIQPVKNSKSKVKKESETFKHF